MSIIITNVSRHEGNARISEYIVQVDDSPIIARFKHWRRDGLAECLRLAATAVDEAEARRRPLPRQEDDGR
jgi:hypothetical protein